MTAKQTSTEPVDQYSIQAAPRLTLQASVKDATGAEWVHQDYQRVSEPWAVEQHVGPIKATERLGDIESWTRYVARFSGADTFAPLLTWSEAGLRAVLDYHTGEGDAGRAQWVAEHPFARTVQWLRWSRIADGHGKSQSELLEFFEDNAPDIVAPAAAEVARTLRTLRATVNATSETTLEEDGSTAISYAKTAGVKASGELRLPPAIEISIPLLKGHTVEDGGRAVPVHYSLEVKLRVSVGPDNKPVFRLTIPRSEQAFEDVYADRVAAARTLLGDGFDVYRATSDR